LLAFTDDLAFSQLSQVLRPRELLGSAGFGLASQALGGIKIGSCPKDLFWVSFHDAGSKMHH
jgi:hypothetical protein